MAGKCTYSARDAADDTLCPRNRQEYFTGCLGGASSSSSTSSPTFFETIGGFLYRKKLEKGMVQYREVLDEDKRLQSIQALHAGTPGRPHHTLEDTYRLVAEHYWWKGMYFQVREFVLSCEECHPMQAKKKRQCLNTRNMSKIVKSHSHEVLSKLNSQREAGLFCDITLKTGRGNMFVAHKAVLAAVSEYFQELFTEMDSTDAQPYVDLTGFSEESLLALLEFSYTSTLTLNLGTLTEVAAMARHLRMWPALEACSALQSEQEAGQPSVMPEFSPINTLRNQGSAGFKQKKEKEQLEDLEPLRKSTLQSKVHIAEGTNESDKEDNDQMLPTQCLSRGFSSFQSEDNGFPCSPTRRMKLMDFKSPSNKRKLSPRPLFSILTSPSTSTRSCSPSRRLLRSTPGAALALRRLLPKIDLSSKRKKKSPTYEPLFRVKSDFSVEPSQSQPNSALPVRVKQEAEMEERCSTIPQDEVHSPRAQEKYRLLSFLGLQRKSLVHGPEEFSGWGQKKRLRKLKVSDYSLTARRKPRTQSLGGITSGLGDLMGVNSSMSLCDMTRMDLLKKVIKVEPHVNMEKKFKRKNTSAGQMEHLSVRTTRSQSMKLNSVKAYNDRPFRTCSSSPKKQLPRPPGRAGVKVQRLLTPPKKVTTRTKQEPQEYAILHSVAPSKARVAAPKGGSPVDHSLRITTIESKRMLRYNIERSTSDKLKSLGQGKSAQGKTKQTSKTRKAKRVRESKKNTAPKKRIEVQVADPKGTRGLGVFNINHQHYDNHLYKVIKEEPVDPLPLTQPILNSDASDLGKRQSKPPVKLLDQGFLFGLCRPSGGIKREEDSVDICLTRSVSHSSASHSNTSLPIVKRNQIRARLTSARSGLNGPHWAGLGNRSTSSSKRVLVQVKKEEENIEVSQDSKAVFLKPEDSKGTCKEKREPAKNVNKLYPVSCQRTVMLESIRRARSSQQKSPCGQSSSGAHVCLQCRASYRDCDGLIMHRIRHIKGKHWPCPVSC
ncbi:Zinc finger and BTB domain-containing protein 11 [Bagarius yarrelli]|uniref:Zinc finger and BTB domain-containing protein 11 n=1 Tax=Bagarius yarrelli TaxID=175774 RepID=A0A556V4Q1_BAGYA|nr:Zinc finger and BTB domain-containing protein 11 [Bagarius yarrelli]